MTEPDIMEESARAELDIKNFNAALHNRAPIAYVTYTLIAINLIVFIAMVSKGAGIFEISPSLAYSWGANFPGETINGQWWRLLSAAFIHYGIVHLLVNMSALYQSGVFVERAYGRIEIVVIYIFSAIFSGLATLIFNTNVVSAGASGAIFGLIVAEALFFGLNHKKIPSELYKNYFLSLSVFMFYNIYYGLTNKKIDNWAHLGGALGCLIIIAPIMTTSFFKSHSNKQRWIKITGAIFTSCVAIFLLISPAIKASQDYINGKKFEKTLSDFSVTETALFKKYNEFMGKSDHNSLVQFDKYLEDTMISSYRQAKSNLIQYNFKTDSKMFGIQKEIDIYLDLKIKLLTQLLSVIKDYENGREPNQMKLKMLSDYGAESQAQDKKISKLFEPIVDKK